MSAYAVDAVGRDRVGLRLVRLNWSSWAVLAAAAALSFEGYSAVAREGLLASWRAGEWQMAGPTVIGFVAVITVVEQIWGMQRRPMLARGQRMDALYLLVHATVAVPLVILIGAGASTALLHVAPWVVLPKLGVLPRVAVVGIVLVAIDCLDWVAHLANHRITTLWRFHEVHHSQEELSILSTFRTNPLVHLTFAASVVPVLAFARNAVTPSAVLAAYACLGALPHANLPWTYGPVGRVLISPAYHRLHHRPEGRLDINLGTVLACWDVLSGRGIFPSSRAVPATGLGGRPFPVEQATGETLPRILVRQLVTPFRR